MPCQREVQVFDTPAELSKAAASKFISLTSRAIQQSGKFTVALSGGSTPRNLYSLLASTPAIPWDRICFFWGDERHVPPDDPESNYRMAHEALLSKVPLCPENVFRIPAEEPDATVAAARYEQQVRDFFTLAPGQFPRFDLMLLGIGPDGHTASLFPNSAALNENTRLVVANRVEKFNTDRITMTFPVLNHSACVMFLVSGKDKALALKEALGDDPGSVPAARVCPLDGRLIWLVDREAASSLPADQQHAS
jgi:6-phosphogluconolactonase